MDRHLTVVEKYGLISINKKDAKITYTIMKLNRAGSSTAFHFGQGFQGDLIECQYLLLQQNLTLIQTM
jgi:hypothetical protein